MNNFSAPLPFDLNYIDLLASINEKYKKSKITMLYNCLPANALDCSGFEQIRASSDNVRNLDDLLIFVKHARNLGMDFTYLLNSINTPHPEYFKSIQNNFRRFLEKLLENDITNIRVSNTLVTDYIMQNYPQFSLLGSTSQEYWSLKQYENYFKFFPTINEIVPSFDLNHNFEFLKNFKLKFPNKTIELMVNEGCMSGCPLRHDHHSFNTRMFASNPNDRFYRFFTTCSSIIDDKYLYLCLSNLIYPWDIETYNNYGIYNFKLIGRNSPIFFESNKYIKIYDSYLCGVEDPQSIYEKPFLELNNYTAHLPNLSHIKVKDVIDLLPKLSYFEKNGHLCSVQCGIKCHYCYDLAKQLKNKLSKGE